MQYSSAQIETLAKACSYSYSFQERCSYVAVCLIRDNTASGSIQSHENNPILSEELDYM